MTITYGPASDDFIVELNGEFDESVARGVRYTLDTLIDNFNFKRLIIEMTNVSFLDSTGIGVVLGRFKKLRQMGRTLCVKNVNKQVDKVFSTCGLYEVVSKL